MCQGLGGIYLIGGPRPRKVSRHLGKGVWCRTEEAPGGAVQEARDEEAFGIAMVSGMTSGVWAGVLALSGALAAAPLPARAEAAQAPEAAAAPAAEAGPEPGLAGRPAADRVHGVAVRVESPAPGTVMQGQLHQAEVVGSATADADQPARYDVFIVLDVSESTNTVRRRSRRRRGDRPQPTVRARQHVPAGGRLDRPAGHGAPRGDPGGADAAAEPRSAPRARGRDLVRGRGRSDHAAAPAHRPGRRVARRAAHRRLRARRTGPSPRSSRAARAAPRTSRRRYDS